MERFGDRATLAEVTLHTGRTHQIRVHLSEAGHPGPGRRDLRRGRGARPGSAPSDPLRLAAAAVGRQALHAWKLAFRHPRTGRLRRFEAPVPADLAAAIAILRRLP